MAWFRGLQRFRHSRGYGVHSPFAFNLIRKVLRSNDHFYAFEELAAQIPANYPEISPTPHLNRLAFRIVRHCEAKEVLEINSGVGVTTLYLLSTNRGIHCTCVEKRSGLAAMAGELIATRSNQCTMLSLLPQGKTYDAMMIHLDEEPAPSSDSLIHLSRDGTFWLIHPVNTARGKQFWHNIVIDERFGVTFDMNDIGIAFVKKSCSKLHYDL